jgi:hypothetical protein
MSININVSVEQVVPRVNDEGLVLVVFANARKKTANTTAGPKRINSLAELVANFGGATPDAPSVKEFNELYTAEYLIRAGVNLLCYATATAGAIEAADITAIDDFDNYQYKMIVAPYAFISSVSVTLADILMDFSKAHDVELFVDLEPFVTAADVSDAETGIKVILASVLSEKTQIFKNCGFPGFTSEYVVPAGIADITVADLAVAGAYAAATDYVGVPGSAACAARKAALLKAGTPWLPIAGENYGLVNEFYTLLESITATEKTALQALNVNVLVMKIGVGNLFVSQNTMFQQAAGITTTTNPLFRGHVITEMLAIKRELEAIASSLLYKPNISKTWNMTETRLNKILQDIQDADGIESHEVLIGLGVTMTEADVAAGILKATVRYLPVRVIEAITFNVVIQQTLNTYDIEFGGE